MSSFLKDLSKVGLSKFFIVLFSLLSGIITARWLGPEGNGIIASLIVYPSLFLTFGSLGISQSATHFIGKKIYDENNIKTSISQIWVFTSIVSVIICFSLIFFFSSVSDNLLWILLAIAPISFTLFNLYNSGIFLGKNQIGFYNKINLFPKIIGFIFIIIFLVIFDLGISGVLIASILGPFVMFVILILKNNFFQYFSFKFNFYILKSLLSLGIIYALALLIINLNYRIDIILLDKFSTPFYTGIYSKGVGIVNFLWEIPMLLSTIVFARSANAKDGKLFSLKVHQLLRLSIIAIFIGSIILMLVARFVIVTFYGIEFSQSTPVLQLLLPGVLLLTFFKVLNMDLAGKGKPWISIKAMLPALILNIGLNIILIPKYNANGAAIASTISYIVGAIIFLFLYSKEIQIPIKEILTYKKDDFSSMLNQIKKIKK